MRRWIALGLLGAASCISPNSSPTGGGDAGAADDAAGASVPAGGAGGAAEPPIGGTAGAPVDAASGGSAGNDARGPSDLGVVDMPAPLGNGPAPAITYLQGPMGTIALVGASGGQLWLMTANDQTRTIVRMSATGGMTTLRAVAADVLTLPATMSPDGTLWYAEVDQQAETVAAVRVTPTGGVTNFPLAPLTGNPDVNVFVAATVPGGLLAAADGTLWIYAGAALYHLGATGKLTPFATPAAGSRLTGLATGAGGSLWFVDQAHDQIGRVAPSGLITTFTLPSVSSEATGIVAGLDGNMWFTERFKLGSITDDGVVTEFPLAVAFSPSGDLALARDGAIWFTNYELGRIASDGALSQFPLDGSGAAYDLVADSDGSLWFLRDYHGVGHFTP